MLLLFVAVATFAVDAAVAVATVAVAAAAVVVAVAIGVDAVVVATAVVVAAAAVVLGETSGAGHQGELGSNHSAGCPSDSVCFVDYSIVSTVNLGDMNASSRPCVRSATIETLTRGCG